MIAHFPTWIGRFLDLTRNIGYVRGGMYEVYKPSSFSLFSFLLTVNFDALYALHWTGVEFFYCRILLLRGMCEST